REIPELAEHDSELEEAMLMQRQRRAAVRHARINAEGGGALYCQVIGGYRRNARIGDPLEQLLVVAIHHRARRLQGSTGLAPCLADELPEAGVQAEDVAFLHPDVVGLPHLRERLVVARDARDADVLP